MAIYYFDTSAVIKRYVDEPGSLWVRQLCDQHDPVTAERLHLITVGEITIVEASAALAILVRRDLIPKRFAQQAYRKFVSDFQDDYKQTRITSNSLTIAANLAQKYPLKAYDAVQLSLALEANLLLTNNNLALTFVSGDDQLLRAAQAEGLVTDNPFAHAP
jgi:uncharacterized protein